MESTVGQMKVGTRLVFGKYGVRNEDPQPICVDQGYAKL